jgi:hypothetical protein
MARCSKAKSVEPFEYVYVSGKKRPRCRLRFPSLVITSSSVCPYRVGFQLLGLGQRGAHLAEVPSLDQHQASRRFLAADEHVEQRSRGDASLQFVAPGAHLPVLAREAEPQIEKLRWHIHTGVGNGLRDAARRGAGLDRQVDAGCRQFERLVDPPEAGCTEPQCDEGSQQKEREKEAAHGIRRRKRTERCGMKPCGPSGTGSAMIIQR